MGYFSELALQEQEENTPDITVSHGNTTAKAKQNQSQSQKKHYNNAQIKEFIDFISATDNFEGSCWQIYAMHYYTDKDGKQGKAPKLICFGSKRLGTDYLDGIYFNQHTDYYYTPNGYYANKRDENTLLSCNNIVIDIDGHELPLETIPQEIDRLLYFMEQEQLDIPEYSVVRSGRGVQLIIRLESFHRKLQWVWKQAAAIICDKITAFINDYNAPRKDGETTINLEVDKSVAVKITGFVRLPYTINQKSKTRTTFEKRTDRRYTVEELVEYIDDNREPQLKPRIKHTYTTTAETDEQADYSPLHAKRVHFIEEIVKKPDFNETGRRELITWLYYNALIQIQSGKTAKEKTVALNNGFKNPLEITEIKAMFRHTDKKIQKLKDNTFLDKMNATAKERLIYENTQSNLREQQREQARAAKAERDEQVQQLFKKGKSYQEIADITGYSLRTVKNKLSGQAKTDKTNRNAQIIELHEQGLSMTDIANKLQCNRRTVSSVLSNHANHSETVSSKRTYSKKTDCRTVQAIKTEIEKTDCRTVAAKWTYSETVKATDGQTNLLPDGYSNDG